MSALQPSNRKTFPENDPVFASNIAEPSIPEQLNEAGFVAGDVPQHPDINYIGWHLTKLGEAAKQNITLNNQEIDSVQDSWQFRSDEVGADDANYPGDEPAEEDPDQLFPNMNARVEMKMSNLVKSISPEHQPISEAEWDDPEGSFNTEYKKTINNRLNRKISDALSDAGVSNLVKQTNFISGFEIVSMTAKEITLGIGSVFLRRADGAAAGRNFSTQANISLQILNDAQSGYQAWGDGNGVNVGTVFADRASVHIFFVGSETGTVNYYADSDVGGANAVQHYIDNTSGITSVNQVYKRRIMSTILILRVDAIYQLLGLSQAGDVFTINQYCEPAVTDDNLDRFLRVKLSASGGYNETPESQTMSLSGLYPNIPNILKRGHMVPPRNINDTESLSPWLAYCDGAELANNPLSVKWVVMSEGESFGARRFDYEHRSDSIVIDYSLSPGGSPANNNWNWDGGQDFTYLPQSFIDVRRD